MIDVRLSGAFEQDVITVRGFGVPVLLSHRQVTTLLDSGGFERTWIGRELNAEHYRHRLGDGTGLHLVLHANGRATLHRDRVHPDNPVTFIGHLLIDVPIETGATILGVWLGYRFCRQIG